MYALIPKFFHILVYIYSTKRRRINEKMGKTDKEGILFLNEKDKLVNEQYDILYKILRKYDLIYEINGNDKE